MGDQKKGVKRKLLSNSQMSNFPFFVAPHRQRAREMMVVEIK